MKHKAVFFAVLIWALGSASCQSVMTTLEAQSLPAVVHVTWQNAADGDGHDNWIVSLDGVALPSVPKDTLAMDVTVTSAGSHTIAIVGQLRALSGNPDEVSGSQFLTSPPQIVSFNLNMKADSAKGGKVTN